jgi:hypothetical protein
VTDSAHTLAPSKGNVKLGDNHGIHAEGFQNQFHLGGALFIVEGPEELTWHSLSGCGSHGGVLDVSEVSVRNDVCGKGVW